MNKSKLIDGIKKQELNLLFVIDKSGSMDGEKIGAVHNAIRDVLAIMPEIQEDTADAEIKISALTFSDDCAWVYNEPKIYDEFKWNDVFAEGTTNYSAVFDELAKFLSKKENGGQMPDFGGVAPIIIFMSDGMPNESDWEEHLKLLNKKGWFNAALKYALAVQIDSQESIDVLTKFTGNPETVLRVYTAEALRKIIKVIAITTSKIKSSSNMIDENGELISKEEETMQVINQELENVPDVEW